MNVRNTEASIIRVFHAVLDQEMCCGPNMQSTQEEENTHKDFVGKPEGKRPLERHKHKWKYTSESAIQKCLRI